MEVETTQSIDSLLAGFNPISLAEMDKVKLMNRVDTKFLISTEKLQLILSKAFEHYRVVEIDGARITPYSSIYFDTNDIQMYTKHHNGKLNRFKIRTRSYLNSGDSFLEIKKKNNKGRTQKKRIRITQDKFLNMTFENEDHDFVNGISPFVSETLIPQLQNFFNRVTLVDNDETERVTLDIGLNFKKVGTDMSQDVSGLVIVEMKQDGVVKSFFRSYLDEMSILPGSMSKYCLGMVLMNPEIKNNRFKKKIRKINKITEK